MHTAAYEKLTRLVAAKDNALAAQIAAASLKTTLDALGIPPPIDPIVGAASTAGHITELAATRAL